MKKIVVPVFIIVVVIAAVWVVGGKYLAPSTPEPAAPTPATPPAVANTSEVAAPAAPQTVDAQEANAPAEPQEADAPTQEATVAPDAPAASPETEVAAAEDASAASQPADDAAPAEEAAATENANEEAKPVVPLDDKTIVGTEWQVGMFRLIFKENGVLETVMGGKSSTGEWKIEGDTLTVSSGGNAVSAKIVGDKLQAGKNFIPRIK